MMYEADERFTAYYDERSGHGAAKALNEIIQKGVIFYMIQQKVHVK